MRFQAMEVFVKYSKSCFSCIKEVTENVKRVRRVLGCPRVLFTIIYDTSLISMENFFSLNSASI